MSSNWNDLLKNYRQSLQKLQLKLFLTIKHLQSLNPVGGRKFELTKCLDPMPDLTGFNRKSNEVTNSCKENIYRVNIDIVE